MSGSRKEVFSVANKSLFRRVAVVVLLVLVAVIAAKFHPPVHGMWDGPL
jgi:hypothetical protein